MKSVSRIIQYNSQKMKNIFCEMHLNNNKLHDKVARTLVGFINHRIVIRMRLPLKDRIKK